MEDWDILSITKIQRYRTSAKKLAELLQVDRKVILRMRRFERECEKSVYWHWNGTFQAEEVRLEE